jgi:YVTN family beta-propeller protein
LHPVFDVAVDSQHVYATHYYTPIGAADSSEPGKLFVLNKSDLSEVAQIQVGFAPRKLAIDSARQRAYVTNYIQNSLSIVDLNARTEIAQVKLGQAPIDVAVNTRTNRVYVTNWLRRKVHVISGETNAEIMTVDVDPGATGITVDEATGLVYVACNFRPSEPDVSSLVVIDGSNDNHNIVATLQIAPDKSQPVSVCVDGTRVYVGCLGGATVHPYIAVFERNGTTFTRLPDYLARAGVTALDVYSRTSLLYAATVNGPMQVFRTDTNSEAAFMPVGRSLQGIAVDRFTDEVYVAHAFEGAVSQISVHVPPPPPPPTLSVSSNGGRMNLFRQAADGTVETAVYSEETDWLPFASIGRVFPPGTRFASLSPRGGDWWLFGVDAAGVLWGTSGTAQAAGVWHQIGTGFVPGAEVAWATPFAGRVFLFAVDASGRVRSFSWSDDGPQGREIVHDSTFAPGAPITAVSRKPGHWDLFVLHSDGKVYTQWWSTDEDSFSAWGPLNGDPFEPDTRISCLGRKDDQLDLFAVDPSGRVVGIFWNNEQGWDRWGPVAGGGSFPPRSPVAVANHHPDNVTLFAIGTDSQLWTTFWDKEDGWDAWGPLGGLSDTTGAAVTAVRRGPGELDVSWLAQNGEVGHTWWNKVQRVWSLERGIRRTVGKLSVFYLEEIRTDKPVRGNVKITLWEDGSYLIKGHIHGSGFDPYSFIVQAAVPTPILPMGAFPSPGFATLQTFRAGNVDGWEPFGDEDRNYDWVELGVDPDKVANLFRHIIKHPLERLIVSHAVKNEGIGGTLDSLVKDVIEFFLGGDVLQAVGGTVVMALALGRELEDLIGIDLNDAPGLLGLGIITAATGGLYWLAVPATAVLIPMATGAFDPAVGARHRAILPEEWNWASQVFGDTLPHFDQITITNLKSASDTAFVSVDGDRYLVHMGGEAFEQPRFYTNENYSMPGQLFIHELTHVWDAFHSSEIWGWEAFIDQFSRGDDPPDPSRPWSDLGIEEKAAAVDHWYSRHHADLDGNAAVNDDYFHYIRDHIRTGVD